MNVEVVYAASLYEQDVREAPASVTIVTADEIRRFGYRTLADILNGVTGFYTSYDRLYSYVGVRGFARPGDYNTRVLLQLNGHRINDNVYESAMLGTEFVIDPDLVERVEIVRGPSSSVYGTNAFFGVVNVVTKKAAALNGAWASGRAESFGVLGASALYGRSLSGNVACVLSGSVVDADGQDLYFAEFDDASTNGGEAEDCDFDRSAGAFADLSRGGFRLQAYHGTREKGIPTGAWGTVFSDPRTVSVDGRDYIELGHTYRASEALEVSSTLSYDSYAYYGEYVYDFGEEGEPLLVLSKDHGHGEWWRGEVQAAGRVGARHRIVTGGMYRYNVSQHQRNYDVEINLDDDRSSGLWAVYAQEEFHLRPGLLLNAGIRHDHYETFGGTTNPRIALIWSPAVRTTFKLLYGSAFRAPNAYELYYDDTGIEGGGTQKANTGIGPEEIRTYEIVLEQQLNRSLRGTASLFHYDADDLITLETDPEDGLLVFRNGGEARANGVEIGIDGVLRRGVRGFLSGAYQKSEDARTGDALTNSPDFLGKLRLLVPIAGERLGAGFELLYVGDRKTVTGGTTDAHAVGNFTLTSRLRRGAVELSAGAYNLFDARYADPVSEELPMDRIEQDGRSFRAEVRFRLPSACF